MSLNQIAEDGEQRQRVLSIAYEALPFPIRLVLRKERFEELVLEMIDRFKDSTNSTSESGPQSE